jgi:hypothetical protein
MSELYMHKRITLSDRLVSAIVACLCAATTAGVLQVVSLMFPSAWGLYRPGAWGWIPLSWLGYFVGVMTIVGFIVGPVKITEVFGFLWGTSTALSSKSQIAILTVIVGVIWISLYMAYLR